MLRCCCRLAISAADPVGEAATHAVPAQWMSLPRQSPDTLPAPNKSLDCPYNTVQSTSYVPDRIKDTKVPERETDVPQYYVINVRPDNRISKQTK